MRRLTVAIITISRKLCKHSHDHAATSDVCGAAFYFMLLLYVQVFLLRPTYYSLQTYKFHSPLCPDPFDARSRRLLGFPKSLPLKNPRYASGYTVLVYACVLASHIGQLSLAFFRGR